MRPLEDITVGRLLRRTATVFPERPAVICRGETITYRVFDRLVDAYAAALLRRGVQHGEHIGIFGETDTMSLALFFAIQRIGAVAVMVGTALEGSDLKTVLDISDVARLYTGVSYVPGRNLKEVADKVSGLPCLKETAVIGAGLQPDPDPDLAAVKASEAAVALEDTAVILFTSGSTGVPKAVMTSNYGRCNSGIQQGADFRTTCEDVFCVTLPMFHCFCISTNIMASVAYGACLCIPEDRHTISILAAIQTYRCTILHSVPSMYRAVLARPDFRTWDISSLRTGIIGGSGYPQEDFEKFEKSFGMTLLSSLGQTEATAGLTISFPEEDWKVRVTTVGHFMDHIEGKIADLSDGRSLGVGEVGEICIRGYLVMQGYYKRPDLTAAAIDADGFLHTGDLGALDENGNVIMKGRIKDLIIRGGENISPSEIEAALAEFRQISVSKVVGIPDEFFGEEACACIVLDPGASLTEAEIRRELGGQLAYYKIPKYILFFDSLPLNATGKIRSSEVKKLAADRLHISVN